MSKQPWLAVFLSLLWPGAGQLYGGNRVRGISLMAIYFFLYILGAGSVLFFVLLKDKTLSQLMGLLFIASGASLFIISIYALFDAHRVAKKFNANNNIEPDPFAIKNPWLAVFLSAMLTGLGQLYNKQWLKGFFFILCFAVISVVDEINYLISLLFFPLSLFSLKDAFDSAERMNGSGQKFVDQGSSIAKIIVAVTIIFSALPVSSIVKAHFIQAYKIPASSMLPTLELGDHILVDKTIQGKGHVKREELIVFVYPEDRSKDFIKRVIAVSGDTIEIRNKKIILNGTSYYDPYGVYKDDFIIPAHMQPRDNYGPQIVPHNSVFVLGDNRDFSHDSRFWGFVDLKDVRGKAFKIYWSWDYKNRSARWDRIGMMIR
jgi:signal peptidase I